MKAKKVMYKGQEIYIRELARKLNVSPSAICNRLRRGLSLDDMGTGQSCKVKTWIINGEELSKNEICKKFGIHKETLRRNIANGTLLSCLRRANGSNPFRANSKDVEEVKESSKVVFVKKTFSKRKKTETVNKPDYRITDKKIYETKRTKDTFEYDPKYESVQKIADKFELKRSRVYTAMQSGKYTIKYIQIRGARCGFILRTEIEAFILECRQEKEKAAISMAKSEQKKTLEELKKEHPLVTDERCFITSWFPKIDSYFILSECNTTNPTNNTFN